MRAVTEMTNEPEAIARLVPPPRCFDDLQSFEQWRAHQRRCQFAASICEDCTAEYRQLMQEQGRCDAWHWMPLQYAGLSRNSKLIGGTNGA